MPPAAAPEPAIQDGEATATAPEPRYPQLQLAEAVREELLAKPIAALLAQKLHLGSGEGIFQALAKSLQNSNVAATCYICGDGRDGQGASFVANLGDNHMVRFLVSDFGISWVESRNGHELVKLEGAEAIQELQRVAQVLQSPPARNRQRAEA